MVIDKKRSHVGGWVGGETEVKKQKRSNEEKRNAVQRRRKKYNKKSKEKKVEKSTNLPTIIGFFGRQAGAPCSSVPDTK